MLSFIHHKELSAMKTWVNLSELLSGVWAKLIMVAMLGHVTGSVTLAAPAVDPSLIDYAKSLSSDEQARLAKQYGITLPAGKDTARFTSRGEELSEESESRIEKAGDPKSFLVPEPRGMEQGFVDTQEDEELVLERFGMSVFQNDGLQTPPTDDTLVPEHYQLGPGDAVMVTLYGKEDFTEELVVDREGQLFVPRLGPVQVSGLNFLELKELLRARVREQLIGVEILVALSGLRKISVFVAGEVVAPGLYNLSSLATLSHAVYAAGGITPIASLRRMELRRNDALVQRFDWYDLLLGGSKAGDQTLRNGDVVFVPVVKDLVSIEGEVLRPAIYEVNPDQTVSELIEMAGGLKSGAFSQGMVLRRRDNVRGVPKVISVRDLNSSLILQDGDSLEVLTSSDQVVNPIEIEGAVVRQGIFEFFEGARISDFVGDYERDLLFRTDMRVALIVRRINAEQDIEVISFSPSDVLSDPKSRFDPELRLFDRVLLLPLPLDEDLEEERQEMIAAIVRKLESQVSQGETAAVVGVGGAIRTPGRYPLFRKGRLNAQFDLAGGLLEGAALSQVELRRQTRAQDRVVTSAINLNLIDGEPDIQLQGNDFLTVKFLQDWGSQEIVSVNGEVRFPGDYLLQPGEQVSDLIRRAGGFTENAHIEATRYRSAAAREIQKTALATYSSQLRRQASALNASTKTESDTEVEVDEALSSLTIEGRVIIDMLAITAGDQAKDLLLQDGDSLYVPRFSETVFVVGEVREPGVFRYSEGLSVQDYIALAAGETRFSRPKDAYLILPSGSVQSIHSREGFFRFGDGSRKTLSPGTTIVVPPNLDYTKPIDLYSQVSSVVFQSVASIAAFFSIANK